MYDYHSHSNFSSDADHSMESMVRGAIEKHVKELAITDHVDYDYTDPTIAFDLDHPTYTAEIHRLQDQYHGQILIRHGLEFGLQPHLTENYTQLVHEQNPDFVICSLHTCKKLDLYRGNYYHNRSPKEAWEDYLHEMLKIVHTYDAYCVLGHLDILRRYNPEAAAYPVEELESFFKELFKELVQKGKGIEVNTSGYRTAENMPLPGWNILQWYHDAGGVILTTGSDAHTPDALAFHFPETFDHLRTIGFKYICGFEQMAPYFHSL